MTYATNPTFREVFHSKVHNVRFYAPADGEAGYHISRVVGAQSVDIYAQSGAKAFAITFSSKRMGCPM